jgi:hypothetical protein
MQIPDEKNKRSNKEKKKMMMIRASKHQINRDRKSRQADGEANIQGLGEARVGS